MIVNAKDPSLLFHSLDSTPVGIMVVSYNKQNFDFINKKCCKILKLTERQVQTEEIETILANLHGRNVYGQPINIDAYPILKNLHEKQKLQLTFSVAFKGIKRIISMRSSPIIIDTIITGAVATVEDITNSYTAQNNLECATLRLENLWMLAQKSSLSIKQVCDITLEAIAEITKSKYGFYGFLSENEENMIIHSWTGETMKGCTMMEKPFVFPIKDAGLWGEAIRQRRPLLVNDYDSCTLPKKGFPAGHVKLNNLMVIPHFVGKKISSVAAVANKEFGYETDDLVRITGFLGDVETVMQRIKTESLLKKSEEKYRNLVELMNEGVLVLDHEHVATFVNGKTCKLLGRDSDEIIGQSFENFLDAGSRDTFRKQQALRKQAISEPYEIALVNKTGEKVFVLSSPTPLLDEEGEPKGSYEVITDISNIKLIETQLLHSQKMETVGGLAAGIAHEINTPLQYIVANAVFLNETTTKLVDLAQSIRSIYADSSLETPADKLHAIDAMMEAVDIDFVTEEIPAAINDAIEGLNRISSIVLSVKQFAHPDFNQSTSVDINKEIQNTLAISTNEWKPYAEVVTELDEDLPQLLCVASDFNQMILNLVVNAAQALQEKFTGTDSKGRITLSTFHDAQFVGISIEDNGTGIPLDIKEKIFNPFFTTKEVGKGTGLGLTIVLKIIEKHKGKIWFESTEGQGTTFFVQLPIV